MATYTKLRDGSWGVRVVGTPPIAGSVVSVTTKAGKVKQETISRVVWSGKDDSGSTVSLCSVGQSARSGGTPRNASRTRGAQYCEGWGADNPHPPKPPYTCTECE